MPILTFDSEGPDWLISAERRAGRITLLENQPLKEAVYTTGRRPEAHHHSTDAGGTPVIVFDLHKTLTPSEGFFPTPTGDYLLPPFEGVKENLDRWAGMGICLHLATAALSPYHSADVLMAREKVIWGWLTKYSLPISWIEGKVAAHVYYDDRMVSVPDAPDWQRVAALIDAELDSRTELQEDGTRVLVELPQTGEAVAEPPDIERIPEDQPRGLSTEVLDVDFHRCLSEANSSQRDAAMKPGAVEAVNRLYDMGFQIDLSCAGWDRSTHDREESDGRLASLRSQARLNGVQYDRFVSKDHGTVFVDDKGLKHTDWDKDLPEIIRRMSTPAPEDEVTRNQAAPKSRPQAKAAVPAHDYITEAITYYAARLRRPLRFGLDPRRVARGFAVIAPKAAKAIPDDPVFHGAALAYVQSLELDDLQMEELIVEMYAEGYILGSKRGFAFLDFSKLDQVGGGMRVVVDEIDWSKWQPGNAAANLLDSGADSGGLRALLDKADVTIKSIQDTRLDALADILASGAAAGDSVPTMAANIEALLDDPDRAEMIANTELNRAVSQASLDAYKANGISRWDLIIEADACPLCEHEAYDNPHEYDDDQPPYHPSCLVGSTRVVVPRYVQIGATANPQASRSIRDGGALAATAVAEADLDLSGVRAGSDRHYIGDVVTIELASGHQLTGTPNHPIGTPSGWVALSELKVGDNVLRSAEGERAPTSIDPDVNHVPPSIQQVVESLPVRLGRMPAAAKDFHGDGAGSEVYVIRANSLLLDDISDPQVAEHPKHQGLGGGDVAKRGLDTQGSPLQVPNGPLTSASGDMGGGREALALLRGGRGHSDEHRIAPASGLDTSRKQFGPNGGPADSEGFCQGLLARSSEITSDQIVRIVRAPFDGHVYNLETESGWYIGNGIVTHNCRCAVGPHR